MTWFVIQCERKIWTKYLVEAENEESALHASDNWSYLSYLDGENTASNIVDRPLIQTTP